MHKCSRIRVQPAIGRPPKRLTRHAATPDRAGRRPSSSKIVLTAAERRQDRSAGAETIWCGRRPEKARRWNCRAPVKARRLRSAQRASEGPGCAEHSVPSGRAGISGWKIGGTGCARRPVLSSPRSSCGVLTAARSTMLIEMSRPSWMISERSERESADREHRPAIDRLQRHRAVCQRRADVDDRPSVTRRHPAKRGHRAHAHLAQIRHLRPAPDLRGRPLGHGRAHRRHRHVHPDVARPSSLYPTPTPRLRRRPRPWASAARARPVRAPRPPRPLACDRRTGRSILRTRARPVRRWATPTAAVWRQPARLLGNNTPRLSLSC